MVISCHCPPTAQNINGNTSYLSQLSDGEAFRSIIQATTADIIGIFCGHCHADAIISDDLSCPIVTITCAGNFSYESDAETRTAGTATETAMDIVTIDKTNRKIYLTRLGVGNDREISY